MMNKKGTPSIKRGQAITFRLPSDTPDHLLKQLEKLKQTEKRNFSSKIAEYVLEGVSDSLSKDREMLSLPLPKQLTKDQRSWLKHSHSEALLGSIVYQLLADPVRASSLLASLSSNALDIDEALYLQEAELEKQEEVDYDVSPLDDAEITEPVQMNDMDDDILQFDLDRTKREVSSSLEEDDRTKEEQSENLEDLLGGFLASMNK